MPFNFVCEETFSLFTYRIPHHRIFYKGKNFEGKTFDEKKLLMKKNILRWELFLKNKSGKIKVHSRMLVTKRAPNIRKTGLYQIMRIDMVWYNNFFWRRLCADLSFCPDVFFLCNNMQTSCTGVRSGKWCWSLSCQTWQIILATAYLSPEPISSYYQINHHTHHLDEELLDGHCVVEVWIVYGIQFDMNWEVPLLFSTFHGVTFRLKQYF